jgi:outer membrane protein TolC
VQGTIPVFENWMGVLERLEIERHYNEITQAKMVLNHQLEEKKFKIYQQYYIYELVTSLQKTRLDTQKRNKSYYDLVNQKRADGVIPEAERLQVFVSNLASEEELINSQQLKEETLLDLKNMIGYLETEPLEIAFEENLQITANNSLDDFENFKTKALAYSFMEKAASLNIQNAMKKVEMVTNMLNPKTDLFFGVSSVIQKTDPSLLISEGNPTTYPNYFVVLQTELFGGSQTETAKVEQAKTDEKSANYDYENFKLILDQFLHKAYLATHYYQEAYTKSSERIIYHRKLMEELKSEFARGRINMQLLTQAENMYQLSELGHLQNKVKLKTAQTAIKYLAGEL